MEKYLSMIVRLLDVRLKGSTTRLASAVLIGLGIFEVLQGEYLDGAALWALGAGMWGLRDAID